MLRVKKKFDHVKNHSPPTSNGPPLKAMQFGQKALSSNSPQFSLGNNSDFVV